jgi:hypothetical protein
MLAAEPRHYSLSVHEAALSEIHHSKISLHHAKEGYRYPTIRLPHTFLKLAGLPTSIYQTVYDGALAFLVVIAADGKAANTSETSVFTRRRSPVRIRPPSGFLFLRSPPFLPLHRFCDLWFRTI